MRALEGRDRIGLRVPARGEVDRARTESPGPREEVDVLVTLIDRAEATTMFTRDGRRLTTVSYQVRNNRRQFLRFALPEGIELDGYSGRQMLAWTTDLREGKNVLKLPLVAYGAPTEDIVATVTHGEDTKTFRLAVRVI